MNIKQVVEKINALVVNEGNFEKEIVGFYAGDFLSHVMGKLQADECWFTIMNNINVAGVACLTDCALVVVCEGVSPSTELLEKAKKEEINLVKTNLSIVECVKRVFS